MNADRNEMYEIQYLVLECVVAKEKQQKEFYETECRYVDYRKYGEEDIPLALLLRR